MATEISSQVLAIERSGGVLRLTLSRPARLNARDDELLDALGAAMVVARDDDSVRCVLITGAGRGFCAGADLTGNRLSGGSAGGDRGSAVRRTLQTLYAPLIVGIRE